jgi:D-serine deaminase-like pyridoxal phosphate-dependent protein
MCYYRAADEHGVIEQEKPSVHPQLGEKLFLIPGHCDTTVNLYDWYVGIRGFNTPDAHVEALWPVAARGAIA